MHNWLAQFTSVKPQERRALFLSFIYLFCLLCGYYMLRPIRDEMAVRVGVESLNTLIWFTFLGMLLTIPLFGWAVSRFSRANLIPAVYAFFIVNLLVFFSLYRLDYLIDLGPAMQKTLAMSFFTWVSIYNLFVISIFWSFMADIYDTYSAKRLFGFIAAGGTAGTLLGSLLTNITSAMTHNGSDAASWLILMCALLLGVAVLCVRQLNQLQRGRAGDANVAEAELKPAAANMWAAIPLLARSPYLLGICVLVFLYSLLSTFLYFMQADIVKSNIEDSQQRIALFASIDFVVNSLTLLLQIFVTARLISKFGLALSLMVIPLMLGLGFMLVGSFSSTDTIQSQTAFTLPWVAGLQLSLLPALLLGIQIFRRAGQYAINRPAREMLYTVVSKEEKYQAKNLIDTTIYRGGDAVSGQIYAELAEGLGLKLSTIAWIAVPVCGLWAMVSFILGRLHRNKSRLAQPSGGVDSASDKL